MKKSNSAVKVAWIGFAGVILAALIAAGFSLYSSQKNSNSTIIQTVTGEGATANSAGRDINVNQK